MLVSDRLRKSFLPLHPFCETGITTSCRSPGLSLLFLKYFECLRRKLLEEDEGFSDKREDLLNSF